MSAQPKLWQRCSGYDASLMMLHRRPEAPALAALARVAKS